jgi:hypothetical protein
MHELIGNLTMQSFVVAYDYGNGGLWGVVDAMSEAEITSAYPELSLVRERPKWMKLELYEKILHEEHCLVTGLPTGILKAVVGERSKRVSTAKGKNLDRQGY